MSDRFYRVIGLMSGTSIDGIDAALVRITEAGGRIEWSLEEFMCVPWRQALREALLGACRYDSPLQTIVTLNTAAGEAFADAALGLMQRRGVTASDITAIASHGQTVWHQPDPHRAGGCTAKGTMQIGDVSVIACRTGCPVIGEFRNADMAMGGQGAPLVPFADFALFASETENRAIQNIGGIANVTWLPAGRDTASIVAFDTGPGNMALDAIARAITDGRLQYDADGAMAGRGHVDRRLLASWLEHPYFAARPPKSTGHEEFGEPYARRLMESAAQSECSSDDLMATATALTAESIAESYRRWLLPLGSVDLVIVGGGGAHNATLMSMIATALGLPRITTHEALGVPDDAKEAIAFALLGWETLRGRPANVPSATGASGPAVLGKIALPPSCGLRPLIDIGAD